MHQNADCPVSVGWHSCCRVAHKAISPASMCSSVKVFRAGYKAERVLIAARCLLQFVCVLRRYGFAVVKATHDFQLDDVQTPSWEHSQINAKGVLRSHLCSASASETIALWFALQQADPPL